jgi:hypothetical protein
VRNLKLGTYPGREYTLDTADMKGRAQIFVTLRKTYVILAIDSSTGHKRAGDVDRFFSSLRISVK